MTYTVLSGTLNSTIPYHTIIIILEGGLPSLSLALLCQYTKCVFVENINFDTKCVTPLIYFFGTHVNCAES